MSVCVKRKRLGLTDFFFSVNGMSKNPSWGGCLSLNLRVVSMPCKRLGKAYSQQREWGVQDTGIGRTRCVGWIEGVH